MLMSRVIVCVCLLLQDLLQNCSRGGEEESGGPLMSTFVFSSQHKDAEYCSLVVGINDSD